MFRPPSTDFYLAKGKALASSVAKEGGAGGIKAVFLFLSPSFVAHLCLRYSSREE